MPRSWNEGMWEMEYSDAANVWLAVMGVLTVTVIYWLGGHLPRKSPVFFLPVAGFAGAAVTWMFTAPKLSTAHMIGLTALVWVAVASVALAIGLAFGAVRRRRAVYRRPGGLP